MKAEVLSFEEYLCLLAIKSLEQDGVVMATNQQIETRMKELLLRISLNVERLVH